MADDYILEIDGIKGESAKDGHIGQIDILSWSLGMSNPGSSATGGGGGTGQVTYQDLHFTKEVESSSHDLQLKCAGGQPITKATLYVRKQGKDSKQQNFLKVTMEQLIVSSYSLSGGGGGAPQESFSLNFAKYKFEYAPQKADGSMEAFKSMSWDLKKNLKA